MDRSINFQTKRVNLEFKATGDQSGERIISGYASTYDLDSDLDRVVPGAWAESINRDFNGAIMRKGSPDIRFCREHETFFVIGKILELREDDHGLFFKAYIAKTSMGDDTYELVKLQALDRISVGFNLADFEYVVENGRRVRLLKKCELLEISVVTFPANSTALITEVKNKKAETEMNKVEKFLEELGEEKQDALVSVLEKMMGDIAAYAVDTENQDVKYCGVCQKDMECSASFCPSCGANQMEDESEEEETQEEAAMDDGPLAVVEAEVPKSEDMICSACGQKMPEQKSDHGQLLPDEDDTDMEDPDAARNGDAPGEKSDNESEEAILKMLSDEIKKIKEVLLDEAKLVELNELLDSSLKLVEEYN